MLKNWTFLRSIWILIQLIDLKKARWLNENKTDGLPRCLLRGTQCMLKLKQTARHHTDWFIWCCMLTLQRRRWSGYGALPSTSAIILRWLIIGINFIDKQHEVFYYSDNVSLTTTSKENTSFWFISVFEVWCRLNLCLCIA